jgi:single-strand DNA-binding protein
VRSVNTCHFIGNVGRAPEIFEKPGKTAVASFSIACEQTWKDGDQTKSKTNWVPIKAFAKLAIVVKEYVPKGSRVYVRGTLQSYEFDGEEGKVRGLEIVADELVLLSTKHDPTR